MNTFIPCFGCGSILTDQLHACLTVAVVGVILILMGLLANVVYAIYVKCSRRFGYNSICWNDIKPTEDNTFLGFLFGHLGIVFVIIPLFIGLIYGVYEFVITL